MYLNHASIISLDQKDAGNKHLYMYTNMHTHDVAKHMCVSVCAPSMMCVRVIYMSVCAYMRVYTCVLTAEYCLQMYSYMPVCLCMQMCMRIGNYYNYYKSE